MTNVANSTIFANDVSDGLQYQSASIDVTISKNVVIWINTNLAVVSSTQSNNKLINSGIVYGPFGQGVVFTGANSVITNNAGALIKSAGDGIVAVGDGTVINNNGTVIGFSGGNFASGVVLGSNTTLNNKGEVYGALFGVKADGPAGWVLNNSGLIHSAQTGVFMDQPSPGLTAPIIINRAGGIIEGDAAAIHTGAFVQLKLTNLGTIMGKVDCQANADDTIVNKGKITGEVHLGGGNDSFNGKGGTSGAIFGEAGNDRLIGSAGKNSLAGGLDKDTLTGGNGTDKFVFNDVLDSALGATHDSILDFTHAQHDKIDLHLIDAITGGADDAFHFIGGKGFHHVAGELRYAHHLLQGDVNADGVADFEIHVNAASLVKGDFVL
jgi:Ca2+-binding RTX toxin-like protein